MKIISGSVAVNDFVRRQTKDSGKTYTIGLAHKEIANYAQDQLTNGNYKAGYRDGVILVQVAEELIYHFICPFVRVTEKIKLKTEKNTAPRIGLNQCWLAGIFGYLLLLDYRSLRSRNPIAKKTPNQ